MDGGRPESKRTQGKCFYARPPGPHTEILEVLIMMEVSAVLSTVSQTCGSKQLTLG